MALKKEEIKKRLNAIKNYAEAEKKIAEEKEGQYNTAFAYGWLRGSVDDVMLNIENLIEDL